MHVILNGKMNIYANFHFVFFFEFLPYIGEMYNTFIGRPKLDISNHVCNVLMSPIKVSKQIIDVSTRPA